MTTTLLERSGNSAALSDRQWRRPRTQKAVGQSPGSETDISSITAKAFVPFGRGYLEFTDPPAPWLIGLLRELSQIGQLEGNWDSYGSLPPDPQCAVAAATLLLALIGPDTPHPQIVPTSRGGVQFEWHRAGADLEIDIESPTRVHVYFEDQRDDKVVERTLSDNLLPLVPLLERISAE